MRIHTVVTFKTSGEIVKKFCKTFTDIDVAQEYACKTSRENDVAYEIISQSLEVG